MFSQVSTERLHEILLRGGMVPIGEDEVPQFDNPVHCVLLRVDHALLQSPHMPCEHRPIDLCHVELVRDRLALWI